MGFHQHAGRVIAGRLPLVYSGRGAAVMAPHEEAQHEKLIALVLAVAVFAPTLAFAGASTDAALGLGAFAVFNQILGGVGVFHRGPVVVPAPVVVARPAPVYVPAPILVPPPRLVARPSPSSVPPPRPPSTP